MPSKDVHNRRQPATRRRKASAPGQTPSESRREVRSAPRRKLVESEALDNPQDRSVLPVEPRCRKCGATFSTEAELLDHSKTCKGGHDPAIRQHSRTSPR